MLDLVNQFKEFYIFKAVEDLYHLIFLILFIAIINR
jgi:hypothetical protein